jgi:hypothetical protein
LKWKGSRQSQMPWRACLGTFCSREGPFCFALSKWDLKKSSVSFYPLFPSPLELSHEVNLDVSHLKQLDLCDEAAFAPDVLIMPSRLKHFSKVRSMRPKLLVITASRFSRLWTILSPSTHLSSQKASLQTCYILETERDPFYLVLELMLGDFQNKECCMTLRAHLGLVPIN